MEILIKHRQSIQRLDDEIYSQWRELEELQQPGAGASRSPISSRNLAYPPPSILLDLSIVASPLNNVVYIGFFSLFL